MDSQLVTSSPICLKPTRQRYQRQRTNPSRIHQSTITTSLKFKSFKCYSCHTHQKKLYKKSLVTKACSKNSVSDVLVEKEEKKGTIVGAVALIIGTSIGSGILTLPQKALPSVISSSQNSKLE